MSNTERVYEAKAKEWDLGETSTGKEQIAVRFEILTEGADMRTITWHGFFTDKTWERTIESLRICGWQGSDLTVLDGIGDNHVSLVIEDELYNGETHAKVKWINRLGGLALKAPMAADKRKAFAAQMRNSIKTLDAANAANAPRAKPAAQRVDRQGPSIPFGDAPPPIDDKDLSF